jgi:hypothetical protein
VDDLWEWDRLEACVMESWSWFDWCRLWADYALPAASLDATTTVDKLDADWQETSPTPFSGGITLPLPYFFPDHCAQHSIQG